MASTPAAPKDVKLELADDKDSGDETSTTDPWELPHSVQLGDLSDGGASSWMEGDDEESGAGGGGGNKGGPVIDFMPTIGEDEGDEPAEMPRRGKAIVPAAIAAPSTAGAATSGTNLSTATPHAAQGSHAQAHAGSSAKEHSSHHHHAHHAEETSPPFVPNSNPIEVLWRLFTIPAIYVLLPFILLGGWVSVPMFRAGKGKAGARFFARDLLIVLLWVLKIAIFPWQFFIVSARLTLDGYIDHDNLFVDFKQSFAHPLLDVVLIPFFWVTVGSLYRLPRTVYLLQNFARLLPRDPNRPRTNASPGNYLDRRAMAVAGEMTASELARLAVMTGTRDWSLHFYPEVETIRSGFMPGSTFSSQARDMIEWHFLTSRPLHAVTTARPLPPRELPRLSAFLAHTVLIEGTLCLTELLAPWGRYGDARAAIWPTMCVLAAYVGAAVGYDGYGVAGWCGFSLIIAMIVRHITLPFDRWEQAKRTVRGLTPQHINWLKPDNILVIITLVLEFAQLNSFAFARGVPWTEAGGIVGDILSISVFEFGDAGYTASFSLAAVVALLWWLVTGPVASAVLDLRWGGVDRDALNGAQPLALWRQFAGETAFLPILVVMAKATTCIELSPGNVVMAVNPAQVCRMGDHDVFMGLAYVIFLYYIVPASFGLPTLSRKQYRFSSQPDVRHLPLYTEIDHLAKAGMVVVLMRSAPWLNPTAYLSGVLTLLVVLSVENLIMRPSLSATVNRVRRASYDSASWACICGLIGVGYEPTRTAAILEATTTWDGPFILLWLGWALILVRLLVNLFVVGDYEPLQTTNKLTPTADLAKRISDRTASKSALAREVTLSEHVLDEALVRRLADAANATVATEHMEVLRQLCTPNGAADEAQRLRCARLAGRFQRKGAMMVVLKQAGHGFSATGSMASGVQPLEFATDAARDAFDAAAAKLFMALGVHGMPADLLEECLTKSLKPQKGASMLLVLMALIGSVERRDTVAERDEPTETRLLPALQRRLLVAVNRCVRLSTISNEIGGWMLPTLLRATGPANLACLLRTLCNVPDLSGYTAVSPRAVVGWLLAAERRLQDGLVADDEVLRGALVLLTSDLILRNGRPPREHVRTAVEALTGDTDSMAVKVTLDDYIQDDTCYAPLYGADYIPVGPQPAPAQIKAPNAAAAAMDRQNSTKLKIPGASTRRDAIYYHPPAPPRPFTPLFTPPGQRANLFKGKAVVILGVRNSGKTTLLHHAAMGEPGHEPIMTASAIAMGRRWVYQMGAAILTYARDVDERILTKLEQNALNLCIARGGPRPGTPSSQRKITPRGDTPTSGASGAASATASASVPVVDDTIPEIDVPTRELLADLFKEPWARKAFFKSAETEDGMYYLWERVEMVLDADVKKFTATMATHLHVSEGDHQVIGQTVYYPATYYTMAEYQPLLVSAQGVVFVAPLTAYARSQGSGTIEKSIELFKRLLQRVEKRPGAPPAAIDEAPIVLFLTKAELLPETAKHCPLKARFEDYAGGADDTVAMIEYITNLYVKHFTSRRRLLRVFVGSACAADHFAQVHRMLLQMMLVKHSDTLVVEERADHTPRDAKWYLTPTDA